MRKIQTALLLSIFLGFLTLLMPSCQNRSIMFRVKRSYPYEDVSKLPANREYKIGLNDALEIQIVPNKGTSLIEGSFDQGSSMQFSKINSVVDFDGTIKIPVLGRVGVNGLTIREAELLFEQRLAATFVDPYVNIRVLNKRVILFPGESGTARVVPLVNSNTNLLEVLASAGGIPPNGKADRIKLIRGDLRNPQIFLIDLSTIEGMKQANLVLEGNDIIYVEQRNDYVVNFLTRITPYLAVVNLYFLARIIFPNFSF